MHRPGIVGNADRGAADQGSEFAQARLAVEVDSTRRKARDRFADRSARAARRPLTPSHGRGPEGNGARSRRIYSSGHALASASCRVARDHRERRIVGAALAQQRGEHRSRAACGIRNEKSVGPGSKSSRLPTPWQRDRPHARRASAAECGACRTARRPRARPAKRACGSRRSLFFANAPRPRNGACPG